MGRDRADANACSVVHSDELQMRVDVRETGDDAAADEDARRSAN